MGRRRRRWHGVLCAALALAALATPAAGAPQRIASLNLCTDQLLVLLADRAQIASVSFLAADPLLSYVADRIDGIALNHGRAEEILAQAPDLVLAGPYGAQATVRLLRAHDVPVVEIDLAATWDQIRVQTARVAEAIGQPARGRALIEAMDRALAEAAPPPGTTRRPSAAIYQANGFTAGAGTLADTVLEAAGFANLAAEAGLSGHGYLSVEELVWHRPDLLILDAPHRRFPSLAHRLMDHPALARLRAGMPSVALPGGAMACGGPFTAEAVTALAAVRARLPRR